MLGSLLITFNLFHNRGRIADLADDVYVFSNVRYFVNEIVEGIINEQWCDCKVLKVLPPSQEEIDQDAEEEREEEEKNGKSPSKKPKAKKSFFPPDHLFKYELQEIEPDNPDDNPVSICAIRILSLNAVHAEGAHTDAFYKILSGRTVSLRNQIHKKVT